MTSDDPSGLQSRYELGDVLGRGGMGTVHRGRHRVLDRAVAIKFLHACDETTVTRFLREGRTLASLRHPNILEVFESGLDGERPYLVCELIEGTDLRARLHEGRLSVSRVLEIATSLARALAHAHDQHVVHRDVKPENVFLSASGEVKLGDFGLARRLEGGETLTEAGVIMGTPEYMAPEQVRGQRPGPATDQYALGALLFEMLSGRPPFKKDHPLRTALARLEEPVPAAWLRERELPPGLVDLVLRCLELDPSNRFQEMSEVVDQLEACARGLASPPSGSSPEEPVPGSGPPRDVSPRARSTAPTVPHKIPGPATAPIGPAPVASIPGKTRIRVLVPGALGLALVIGLVTGIVPGSHRDPGDPVASTAAPGHPRGSSGATLPTILPVPPERATLDLEDLRVALNSYRDDLDGHDAILGLLGTKVHPENADRVNTCLFSLERLLGDHLYQPFGGIVWLEVSIEVQKLFNRAARVEKLWKRKDGAATRIDGLRSKIDSMESRRDPFARCFQLYARSTLDLENSRRVPSLPRQIDRDYAKPYEDHIRNLEQILEILEGQEVSWPSALERDSWRVVYRFWIAETLDLELDDLPIHTVGVADGRPELENEILELAGQAIPAGAPLDVDAPVLRLAIHAYLAAVRRVRSGDREFLGDREVRRVLIRLWGTLHPRFDLVIRQVRGKEEFLADLLEALAETGSIRSPGDDLARVLLDDAGRIRARQERPVLPSKSPPAGAIR